MSFTITINTLEALDSFLFTSSYVEGFQPTQADVKLLDFVGAEPDPARYPNVARWFRHITSFSAEQQAKFPAELCPVRVEGTIGSGAGGSGVAAPAAAAADEDEDFDLFGEVSAEDKAKSEAAVAAAKKTAPVGKSSIVLDIKPWDAETDLDELEGLVRGININDGITWGAARKIDIAFGVKKLQIMMTIIDDKVSSDDLEDAITGFEDHVQSMDVVAWNKV